MYETLSAAERAALEGDNEELDTQECHGLQDDLLSSSSPPSTPNHVASTNIDSILSGDHPLPSASPEPQIKTEADAGSDIDDEEEVDATSQEDQSQQTPQSSHVDVKVPVPEDALPSQRRPVQYRQDHKGKLRAYYIDDQDFRELDLATSIQGAMEDLTQKSSMSLTQENEQSVYEQYRSNKNSVYGQFDIPQALQQNFPSTATPDEEDETPAVQSAAPESLHSKHASARTESTAHTLNSNDQGYVALNYEQQTADDDGDSDGDDDEDIESQDASFAPRAQADALPPPVYEPETPAPILNPFIHRGSVMKGHDLFAATQPSSIGRAFAATPCSRPSPDVYNDFTSPAKRNAAPSSPLAGRLQNIETSPIPSSVQKGLSQSMSDEIPQATIPRTSGVLSFDGGPRTQPSINGPRPYVSMDESQERRDKVASSMLNEESDETDSDLEHAPRKSRRSMEKKIQQELSSVHIPQRVQSSSRPRSSGSIEAVEVPSTVRRRRSIQEEFIAQFEGEDARDTQQDSVQEVPDEIIADSQAFPDHSTPHRSHVFSTPAARREEAGVSQSLPAHPKHLTMDGTDVEPEESHVVSPSQAETEDDPDQEEEAMEGIGEVADEGFAEPELPGRQDVTLPLQELSSNQNFQTPVPNKSRLHSDTDKDKNNLPSDADKVPETSPPEDRLRPMRELATISFGDTDEQLMENLPGFTQDAEFELAMAIGSSPARAPKTTSFRAQVMSAPVAKMLATESIATPKSTPDTNELVHSHPESPQSLSDAKHLDLGKTTTKPSDEQPDIQNAPSPPPDPPTVDQNEPADLADNENIDTTRAEDRQDPDKPVMTDVESQPLTAQDNEPPHVTIDEVAVVSPKINASVKAKTRGKRGAKYTARGRKSLATVPSRTATPRQLTRVDKSTPVLKASTRASARLTGVQSTSTTPSSTPKPSPVPTLPKRTTKRKSGVTALKYDEESEEEVMPAKTTKRQLASTFQRSDSADPLALTTAPHTGTAKKAGVGLFDDMVFAVSFVKNDAERDQVSNLICDNGGRLLEDGFHVLFDVPKPANEENKLALSAKENTIGFTALIADKHSRRAKYMQALALGLPCISGHWILACVAKKSLVDWSPYLLCAGQSKVLGDAMRSRLLQPYPAVDASLVDTFSSRSKLLEGKSVLIVMGKGKAEEKRQAYLFLARALGAARIGQVVTLPDARKKLLASEAEGAQWDILYVDANEEEAEASVFGPVTAASSGSKKRKRAATVVGSSPAPKRIRIMADETMMQSLIFGQLLDDE